jgi:predicted PurR-regulated permease PerM
MVIAMFFAVALSPAVSALEDRISWCRRSMATLVVFVVVLLAIAGLITIFVVPLVRETGQLADKLPQIIGDARAGRGPVGGVLERTHALDWARNNEDKIRQLASGLGTPALAFVKSAATGVAGVLTIFVLSYLMVLEGPMVIAGASGLFRPETGERIRKVGADCARTITGYITGNLLISVICGLATYVVLLILGVPFAGLIALFVAIADLIPLIGATLGAVVATVAGFIVSIQAGIIVVVFFVVYQQVENHLLQPLILSRTVKLNPLTVLIAILVGAELAGILGALLAIPVAGVIQIVLRDIWDHRGGRLKAEPTVGEEEVPVSRAPEPVKDPV